MPRALSASKWGCTVEPEVCLRISFSNNMEMDTGWSLEHTLQRINTYHMRNCLSRVCCYEFGGRWV